MRRNLGENKSIPGIVGKGEEGCAWRYRQIDLTIGEGKEGTDSKPKLPQAP